MAYTTEQIAELLPDITAIRAAARADTVAAVCSEALTIGCGGKGWTFDEIRAIPFTLLAGKIDMRFVEHLNSCVKQCIAIEKVLGEVFGERVPVNHDVLVAGALLADVGKMLEFDKNEKGEVVKGHYGDMLRHPFSGVALCYKHGIPPEVMHVIATHSHEGDKVERTIESWIFHHADFIDFDIAKVLGKRAKRSEPARGTLRQSLYPAGPAALDRTRRGHDLSRTFGRMGPHTISERDRMNRNVTVWLMLLGLLASGTTCARPRARSASTQPAPRDAAKAAEPLSRRAASTQPGALVDGSDSSMRPQRVGKPVQWKIVDGGALEVAGGGGDIVYTEVFDDCQIHVEIMPPALPTEVKGQDR